MNIVYFAPVEWNSIKQRPQHLAQHLAEKHNFYYVQPLGMRRLKLTDFKRILHRLVSFFKADKTSGKLDINNPIFIPVMMTNKVIQKLNIWLLKKQLKHVDADIIWTTSPVKIMPRLLPKLKYKALVYEMLDDYAAIHKNLQDEVRETEIALIKMADVVITTSQSLLEKAKAIEKNKQCVLIGNGVDYDFFAKTKTEMPSELVGMKKIVGYIGAIDKWMDFDTVDFIAKNRPDIDFVFLGPVRVKTIPKRSNLHFIGARDYATLPNYLHAFSVCLIPFIPGEFADSINPVKLYEYFACGKPVVLHHMRELREFKDLVYIADNKEDFLLQLDKALNEKNAAVIDKRKAVAQQYDWSLKAKALEKLLQQLANEK